MAPWSRSPVDCNGSGPGEGRRRRPSLFTSASGDGVHEQPPGIRSSPLVGSQAGAEVARLASEAVPAAFRYGPLLERRRRHAKLDAARILGDA